MTNGEKIQTILDVDRDCTEVHGKNGIMTFSVSQDWWNAEYKEPSSSGKPNKSIEEKCPCYYCEHFEIKGLSHCEIHEEAYGDSRCNDYHKINQKPNKSEISTGSITKNCESCRHYGLHHEICNYCYKCSLWKEKEPTTKNDLGVDCISRKQAIRELKESAEHHANDSREEALLRRDRDIIKALPSVTPQEPFMAIPCISSKVCEHDRMVTLDKIRAEIEQLPTKTRINWDGCCPDIDYPEIEYIDVTKKRLLHIIDKYKVGGGETEP